MKLGRLVTLVVAAVAALPAAGHAARHLPARCRAGVVHPVGTAAVAYAGVARHDLLAFRSPGGKPLARFGRLNQNGYPSTFLIVGALLDHRCRPRWYRVELPLRPNGATGWVRPGALDVQELRTRIVVDLSARRLTLFRRGRRVLTTRVAVGSPATPTPVGRFYVNQRLLPANPNGPFGPAALGVSAFSNVLTGWAQGGPIGIHGTNEPWSIGRAVSNGCIRVPNRTLRRLFAAVPGGTPVVIHQ